MANMADTPDSFEVSAFVNMHGAVHPSKMPIYLHDCYQYALSGRELPENTYLYAPKILGKYYYDGNTEEFILGLIGDWINDYEALSKEYDSFSNYCLSQIDIFEKEHVRLMEEQIETHDFVTAGLFGPHAAAVKEQRRKIQGGIIQKSQIKWVEHKCSIAEKSYYILRDRPPNCIMFFCKSLPALKKQQSLRVKLRGERTVTVDVSYHSEQQVFEITFKKSGSKVIFSFEDLHNIVRTVVAGVTESFDNPDFNLNIFDFTCCETIFPQDECLRGLIPQLLSSRMLSHERTRPKLIYGTIREDVLFEESEIRSRPFANGLRIHSEENDDSVENPSLHEESLDKPSVSIAAPPTPTIDVTLFGGVESFVDFGLSVFTSSTSVSPGRSDRRGGRLRVLKKVSRKRITRGRRNRKFRAKGSTRRTRRKQK